MRHIRNEYVHTRGVLDRILWKTWTHCNFIFTLKRKSNHHVFHAIRTICEESRYNTHTLSYMHLMNSSLFLFLIATIWALNVPIITHIWAHHVLQASTFPTSITSGDSQHPFLFCRETQWWSRDCAWSISRSSQPLLISAHLWSLSRFHS